MKPLSFPVLLTILLTLFLPFNLAYPADPPAGQVVSKGPVTVEVIKAKIKEVEANVDLDKNTKGKLTNRYRMAISNLEMERSNDKAADEFLTARKTATEQARNIRKKLEQAKTSSSDVTLNITKKAPLTEIKQFLLLEEANLVAIKAKLSDAKEQLDNTLSRPAIVQKRLLQAKKRQGKIAGEIKVPAPKTESPLETEVRNWMLATEELAIRAEIKMLDQELLSQPMRVELLRAQVDQKMWKIKPIEERVHKLQEWVNEQHLAQAEKTEVEAQVAQQMSRGKHALVQMMAEQNVALSQDISFLAASLEDITNRKDDLNKEAERLQENYQISKQRIELFGMRQELAKAFAEQSRRLKNLAGSKEKAGLPEKQIAEINMTRIQYNDEAQALKNIPNYVANLTADLSMEISKSIEEELKDLAEKRQELLSQALNTQRTYLLVLNEIDVARGRFLEIIKIYKHFLEKYLLWVRNTSLLTPRALLTVPDQFVGLLSPANWDEAVQILKFQVSHSPILMLPLVLLAIIFWKRKWLINMLERTGKEVGNPASDRFIFTVQALSLTLMIAAPWPIFMEMLGWKLDLPESTVFTQAVSLALKMVAPAFYFLLVFRFMTIPNGFAEAHLRWSAPNLQRLRFELRWFMLVFLPILLITAISVFSDYGHLGGELGRIGIMALLITIAVIFYRLLRPRKGIVCGFLAQHPTSFLTRWHHLWFALVLVLTLFAAALTFSGYIYSSGMLFGRLYRTVGLISALVILYFLGIRWVLLVLNRKASSKMANNEGSEIDYTTLDKESRQLISYVMVVAGIFGLWYIWLELLPALGILDNITLWYHTKMVSGVAKNLPVTLGDICLAIIILFIIVGGLKHLSTFQEIVLRQFTSMRPSVRYASITLSSYAILAIGTALVFSLLGGSWKEIQWIFAALGVGIGFGLQEIVANFICGLIILFERPIRIGDVVTIGDIDGTVSRIQIRATTITLFDKKELLVPNKEFITGRLINWSLSDPITRVTVSVEITYGSDIQKAMSLMSQTAEENKWVLKSPAPFVTIEGFVDNRLKLILRCYIDLIEHRLQTITALHEGIARKFNEAGIIIPAPQRDLYLNTPKTLDVRLKQDDKKPEP